MTSHTTVVTHRLNTIPFSVS